MLERSVTICNSLGLHARAAAKLVRLAGKFESSIQLKRVDTGVTANAKSILSILYIAAGIGSTVSITTEGRDEADAMEAIEQIFLNGFGEI
jgi:phosphocarrier protein HPr